MKKRNIHLFIFIFTTIVIFVGLSFLRCVREEYIFFVKQPGLENEIDTTEYFSNLGWIMLILGIVESITLKRNSKGSLILGTLCSATAMLLTIKMPDIYDALNRMFPIYGGLGYYQYSHNILGYVVLTLSCIICAGFIVLVIKNRISEDSEEKGGNEL